MEPRDTWYSMKIDWFLEEDKRYQMVLILMQSFLIMIVMVLFPSTTKSTVAGRFCTIWAGAHKLSGPPYNGHAGRSWFLTEFKMRKGNPLECSSWTSQEAGSRLGPRGLNTLCAFSAGGSVTPPSITSKEQWCEPRSHGCCLFFCGGCCIAFFISARSYQ